MSELLQAALHSGGLWIAVIMIIIVAIGGLIKTGRHRND